MAIFLTTNSSAKQLKKQNFRNEKELQAFVEQNMESFFGIRFLASEFTTSKQHGGRIDSLGLDENNSPVIIEYKWGEKDNIINQGLFYLDWLVDHKGDFQLLVQKKLGKDIEVDFDAEGMNRMSSLVRVRSGRAALLTDMITASLPVKPPLSLTTNVIVCLPADKSDLLKQPPIPISPSLSEYHLSEESGNGPSSWSTPEPLKIIISPDENIAPFAGEIIVATGLRFVSTESGDLVVSATPSPSVSISMVFMIGFMAPFGSKSILRIT